MGGQRLLTVGQAGAEIAPRPVEAVADGDVVATLRTLAHRYPPELVAAQVEDVPRIAFHIALVRDRQLPSDVICDLGGGVGLFSLGCAALGMSSMLVDDFADTISGHRPDSILALHRAHRVDVRQQDVTAGLNVEPESLGAVTCFHSIEHWHSSPKKLLADVMTALLPGGLFILAAPNAVNLRKRISVPLGFGNWSSMAEWYDTNRFRGHVREPVVADLRTIAGKMGLIDVTIVGRNWLGLQHRRTAVRLATRLGGRLLELQPSLCSDIYVIGRKPVETGSRFGW
jgi:2-polyprenyl-3-methyl-5-hydroxy-6-metoxy-1,4-benzoquinol methylase